MIGPVTDMQWGMYGTYIYVIRGVPVYQILFVLMAFAVSFSNFPKQTKGGAAFPFSFPSYFPIAVSVDSAGTSIEMFFALMHKPFSADLLTGKCQTTTRTHWSSGTTEAEFH